jgi:hypothetical protein
VTSGERVSVAHCRYCGKEFDSRRFQVVLVGSRGTYHSTECALLAAGGEPAPRMPARFIGEAVPLKRR